MTDYLGPYELNSIITGDARELAKAIPDESIDLIFTDPVYNRIEDYEWLAETAARVLKPDRACLVWCAHPMSAHCQLIMEKYGLEHIYNLTQVVRAKPARLNYFHVFLWSTPCLWLNKGYFAPYPWITDTFISDQQPANRFKWNKNPDVVFSWLKSFSKFEGIVLDFFAGGGTVAAVCKRLGRRYLAFEIDPETAELARQRVANTQPPLPQFNELVQQSLLEMGPA